MIEAKQEMKVGDKLPDGTVYAGISPGTHKPIYAMPQDAPLTYTFNDAAKYAEQLNAQKYLGHDDWRVPDIKELNLLYNNRNRGQLKSTFQETATLYERSYWSSSLMEHDKHRCLSQAVDDYGFMRDFGTTSEYSAVSEESTLHKLKLRCVR
jgi:hypothetical protein